MPSYENLDYGSPDGALIGRTSTNKVAFFGGTPVSRRAFASAVHVSSNLAVSASFGATQLAAIQEIQNTLAGLGIWATA
jgi:hypothetical protein